MSTLFTPIPHTRAGITPRDYQSQAHDVAFELWDTGTVGVLCRAATGTGKTLMGSLWIDTWLRRSDRHKAMVVSYETQLVHQFAEEIEDYIGIKPEIEMESASVAADAIPQVVVASRQSLLRAAKPTPDQLAELSGYGVDDIGAAHTRAAKNYLKHLGKGGDRDDVVNAIIDLNRRPEVNCGFWSRLHKFDWRYTWLVIFDEAHRHAYHLKSISHVVDWFERNPDSRRGGLTATPKRGDGVSIGHKMFPGICLDFPLHSRAGTCAVKEGYAVPYVQRYIEVEGVDFKNLKKIAGDYDDADLERVLGEEGTLARLVEPLLDMVGDRRCLIFSPGKDMAKNVARYINARCKVKCACGKEKWYPIASIGDGAECPQCHAPIDATPDFRDSAKQIDGDSPPDQRREVYRGHHGGAFQFLSVCGLCREGYNDPDISCVAVFRPVSKKASSLAEQMKGRGCRPASAIAKLLHTLPDAAARLDAIAKSAKPDCLIVDLVGITGLADCASTVDVYSDGLPDEVRDKAAEILAAEAVDDELDIDEVIARAAEEIDAARAKVKEEREAAERQAREEYERRAKAEAQVTYTTHEVGFGSNDPDMASDGQHKYMKFLGMIVTAFIHRGRAGRIIDQLKRRVPAEEVARTNRLGPDDWQPALPSDKQIKFARWKGVPTERATTPRDMSLLIDARMNPDEFVQKQVAEIAKAKNADALAEFRGNLKLVHGILRQHHWQMIVDAGIARRKHLDSLGSGDEIPE